MLPLMFGYVGYGDEGIPLGGMMLGWVCKGDGAVNGCCLEGICSGKGAGRLGILDMAGFSWVVAGMGSGS